MSEKTWYEHLDEEDLDGKHVQVTLTDGTVLSGRLTVRDDYPDVALLSTALVLPYEDGTKADWPIGVMCQTEDPRWLPFEGVTDISLVWDERDWERIEVKDMMPGDVAVVCGRLIWGGVVSGTGSLVATSTIIPLEMVSCVLRCRSKLPTEPGFYRSDSGELLYLAGDSGWWLIGPDGPSHLSLPFADLMPLTRVHFVDGREETSHEQAVSS